MKALRRFGRLDWTFALMRLAAVLGGWAWVTVDPAFASETWPRTALGVLLLAFVTYSLALIAGILYRPGAALKCYRASSALDLFFVSALVYLTGGMKSDFYLAYYVLIGLHTFYYSSMTTGLATAASSGALYTAVAALAAFPDAVRDWYVIALRVIFFFLVAVPSGVAAEELARRAGRLREYSERVVELNQRLDERLAQANLLYQAMERLLEAKASEDPLEMIVLLGTRLLEAEAGALYQADGSSGSVNLYLRATAGERGGEWPESLGAGSDHIVAKAFRADDGPMLERSPLLTDVVACPVAAEESPSYKRGVIVYRRREGPFSDADVERVEALADLAAAFCGKAVKLAGGAPTKSPHSFLDSRTGLYNRDYFLSRLAAEMNRAATRRRTVAVAIISTAEGRDGALVQALRINARGPDIVARLAPGEFGVLLPETDEAAARENMAEVLRAYSILLTMPAGGVPEVFGATGEEREETVRLGFSFYPPFEKAESENPISSPADLVAQARSNQQAVRLVPPFRHKTRWHDEAPAVFDHEDM